jgi:NADPH2:quinone reductase
MEKMEAAYLERPGKIVTRRVPIPSIEENEVLVKVARCGVCMTDVHMYKGIFPVKTPVILGHEFSGTIKKVGEKVSSYANLTGQIPIKIGDRVSAIPIINCGSCPTCLRGRGNLCESAQSIGGAGEIIDNGAFAQYIKLPTRVLYKLPDNLSYTTGAFIEVTACCIHGIDLSRIKQGDSVLLIGAGMVGLLLLELIKLQGPSQIIVSEGISERRKLAKARGADFVVDPMQTDPVNEVRKITSGQGTDVVIEAVGSPQTTEQAIQMAKKGGIVNIFGVADIKAFSQIKPFDIYFRELTLVGTYALTLDTFNRAARLLASGRLDIDYLLTEEFPLCELEKAILMMEKKEGLKKQIVMTKQ